MMQEGKKKEIKETQGQQTRFTPLHSIQAHFPPGPHTHTLFSPSQLLFFLFQASGLRGPRGDSKVVATLGRPAARTAQGRRDCGPPAPAPVPPRCAAPPKRGPERTHARHARPCACAPGGTRESKARLILAGRRPCSACQHYKLPQMAVYYAIKHCAHAPAMARWPATRATHSRGTKVARTKKKKKKNSDRARV